MGTCVPLGYAAHGEQGSTARLLISLRRPEAARSAYETACRTHARRMSEASAREVQRRKRAIAEADEEAASILEAMRDTMPANVHNALAAVFMDGSTWTRAARNNHTQAKALRNALDNAARVLGL